MEFVKTADSLLNVGLSNPYIMMILKVSLALYGAQVAPKPPQYLLDLFKNTYVKIAAVFLILYMSEKDIQLALLISIIYVVGMNVLAGRNMFESFADYSVEYKPYGNMKLIEPKSNIYPGCHDITMDDLYKVFEGDAMKMQQATQQSFKELYAQSKTKDAKEIVMNLAKAAGLPYNMSFDKPETAPYIATLLVNYGMNIKGECRPPHN